MKLTRGIYELEKEEKYRSYNTIVFIDDKGDLIYKQRKTHLYDAFKAKESKKTIPSANPFEVIETKFGKIGLINCYEIRFPEIARKLVLKGADILVVPTAWISGIMKEVHWQVLL